MSRSLTILLIIVLFLSCQKRKDCDSNSTTIIGTWNWQKSVGGLGGGTNTPETTGEKITILITADSIYKEYLNNSLITESKFVSTLDTSINLPYLNFNGMMDLTYQLVDCNNLILTDRAADGYTNYYKRK